MGVTGLWTVLQPCARPIKLEALNKKRLAVDASIWIYQFLKAVRDKEGNALRNSHVVGFFRRICKLLFFGIKPVFVFDGGAPALKRQTISGRKKRREGRREDAIRTAGKLLAVQMQRRAEEEDRRRREERDRPRIEEEEEEIPDNLVYAEELGMTKQERQQNRQFKKKDAYHLPDLDVSLSEMGAPNDPRIMSQEELEEYARQFHTGEDINLYDFSKIDFNSPFFLSLPASDRYNILNAARLRSRLRMGYSKDQLDKMFPDRMAFSRFQIERVKERNELTTRLMNINGMNGEDAMAGINGVGRIAGEKGREYVLVKNEGVEGGWVLGVVSNKEEGKRNKPIDVERLGKSSQPEPDDDESEDEAFEDVPIEGLNRLPKRRAGAVHSNFDTEYENNKVIEQRRALYASRKEAAGGRIDRDTEMVDEDPDALFFPEPLLSGRYATGELKDDLFGAQSISEEQEEDDEEEELNRAIAMSLGNPEEEELSKAMAMSLEHSQENTNDEDLEKAIAVSLEDKSSKENLRKGILASLRRPTPSEEDLKRALILSQQQPEDEELHEAIRMSLESTDQGSSQRENPEHFKAAMLNGPRIDRPLDFNQRNAKAGRAFAHLTNSRAEEAVPKPFVEDLDKGDDLRLNALLSATGQLNKETEKHHNGPRAHDLKIAGVYSPPAAQTNQQSQSTNTTSLQDGPSKVNGFSGPLPFESLNLGNCLFTKKKKKPVEEAGGFEKEAEPKKPSPPPWFSEDIRQEIGASKAAEEKLLGTETRQDNEMYAFRDRQVVLKLKKHQTDEIIDLETPKKASEEVIEVESSSDEDMVDEVSPPVTDIRMDDSANQVRADSPVSAMPNSPRPQTAPEKPIEGDLNGASDAEEPIEWEESDHEAYKTTNGAAVSKSTSPEIEDVNITQGPTEALAVGSGAVDELPPGFEDAEEQDPNEVLADDEDDFSDPEDEELMRQLAVEAEEHARFASSLNANSQMQTAEDYERELRQLRNQQKKDRRDADEVSHVMITECQQLLKLFGLPYVTAPMEAEAQCAELVSLGLVDGIVTDDSDTFLFGGTRVYKNMFNQAKFVECYLASDLEKEYSLDRNKIIQIAHLLGSDYTEGIPSIGPVTALEILSEFETLERFKDWWSNVQRGMKMPEDNSSPFRRKFKRNAAKLFLPPTFPDKRVDHAYLHPEVDSDPSPFQWGVPDLDALRQFLMATIGWSQERADEILVPVIKDMNRRENEGTQANITQFFGGTVGVGSSGKTVSNAYAPRRRADGKGKSKRMENALGRLHAQAKNRSIAEEETVEADGTAEEIEVSGETETTEAETRKRKTKARAKRVAPKSANVSAAESEEEYEALKRAKKKRKSTKKVTVAGMDSS